MAHTLLTDQLLSSISEAFLSASPASRGVQLDPMLPASTGGVYDQPQLLRSPQQSQPMVLIGGGTRGIPPPSPPTTAQQLAMQGLAALQLAEPDVGDVLSALPACGGFDDAWLAAAAVGGTAPAGPAMGLAQQQLTPQAYLQQQLAAGGAGGPMLMPTAPRAPRVRRHSMYVAPGQPARGSRRNSMGAYEAAALLAQQPQAAAILAAGGGNGGGAAGLGPMPSNGRVTPNGYLQQAGLSDRVPSLPQAVPLGLGQQLPLPLPQQQQQLQAQLQQQQLQAQLLQQQAQAQAAQAQAQVAQMQAQLLAQAQAAGAFVATGPRAPASGASRRHSWCPTTVYYSTEGPRTALQARLAYRAVQPSDALAALQLGADGSISSGSYSAVANSSTASLTTPGSSVLIGSQPASPISGSSTVVGHKPGTAGGAVQYIPAQIVGESVGGGAQYLLVQQQAPGGDAGPPLRGYALPGDGLPPELLQAAAAAGMLPGMADSDTGTLLLDPASGLVLGPAGGMPYTDRWDQVHAAPRPAKPGGGRSAAGGRNGSGNGAAAGGPTGSTPAAQLQLLPVPPPASKVCGDSKWELRRTVSETSGDTAAASLENLNLWLESRRTLAGERLRAERRAARAKARAASEGGADDAAADGAFAYALPDAGDDTWGAAAPGSSAAARAACSGSGAISSEPSTKLFIGNIGWWVSEEDLLAWFSRFGNVTGVKIMYNSRKMHKPKDKWRSREYGFVDYATPAEAARAIVWMDGVELPELMKDDAGIIVQYARPAAGGD